MWQKFSTVTISTIIIIIEHIYLQNEMRTATPTKINFYYLIKKYTTQNGDHLLTHLILTISYIL